MEQNEIILHQFNKRIARRAEKIEEMEERKRIKSLLLRRVSAAFSSDKIVNPFGEWYLHAVEQ